ncbi:MAG: Rne/Rng family ribonuclease [Fimbriiglobus sp.]
MLINVLQPEECRIAIIEDGVLEELYVERANQESYIGNIYKGRIVNIEPGIQAAFVDFGIGRNGFLHASDVDPVYYKHLLPKEVLAEMEAAEAEEERESRSRAERSERPERSRDRPARGERTERPERSERPQRDERRQVRFTEVESVVTVPPPAPAEPIEDSDFGFGIDEAPTPAPKPVILSEDTPPPLPPEARMPAPKPAPVPPPVVDEFEDDGFGSGLLDDEPAPVILKKPAAPMEVTPLPEEAPTPLAELIAVPEPEAEPEAEEPRPKAKGRGRAKAKKVEEPEVVVEEEAKKPAKGRKPRKKAEETDDINPDIGDEKPKPMPGAERRSSPDDEPEIQPFFTDGPANDFDPDAPNDRFSGAPDNNDDDNETPVFTEVLSDEGEETGEAVEASEEEAPPRRRDRGDRDRGDRGDRDRGRGRGRERSRDRDDRPRDDRPRDDRPREDRPRDRDSGPRERRSFSGGSGGPSRGGPRERGNYNRPLIQDIFKRGQEVIVQVIKEAIGTKAPNLSTFISIAGRYLVLMPSLNRVGVSRKIEDVEARKRLREIMNRLNPPKGVGFIVRTAAIDRNEQELQNDLAYLLRLWQVVAKRIKRVASPVEIYRESDMITRTIRDNFTSDINTIYVDEEHSFAQASEFLQIVMPRYADRIRFFSDTEPLFNKYGVEDEIAKINNKRIDLPQGGSIIIEQTEALVAIDVNSGNFRADNNAEETAFQVNLIAAREIARQLRLRDLGGVIVNDFIDMRSEGHRRKVEDALRTALKRDRARTKILRISQFGIIEMTRQRIQPSLKKRIFNECPHCKGTGYVKTCETMGIEVMRHLQLAAHRKPVITSINIVMHTEAAFHLLNRKRKEIAAIEERGGLEVSIEGKPHVSPEHLEVKCLDAQGSEVRLFGNPTPPTRQFRGNGPREFRNNDRRPPALD